MNMNPDLMLAVTGTVGALFAFARSLVRISFSRQQLFQSSGLPC